MHILIFLIFFVSVLCEPTASTKQSCLCPASWEWEKNKDDDIFMLCGKELNFINGNSNCENETGYKCRQLGTEATISLTVGNCQKVKKICNLNSLGIYRNGRNKKETCSLLHKTRMCSYFNETSLNFITIEDKEPKDYAAVRKAYSKYCSAKNQNDKEWRSYTKFDASKYQ